MTTEHMSRILTFNNQCSYGIDGAGILRVNGTSRIVRLLLLFVGIRGLRHDRGLSTESMGY